MNFSPLLVIKVKSILAKLNFQGKIFDNFKHCQRQPFPNNNYNATHQESFQWRRTGGLVRRKIACMIRVNTKMRHFHEILSVVLLFSAKVRSNKDPVSRSTSVVSLDFCESSLSAKDKINKSTLEKIHTYAELKHDPQATLPDSFSICSTIMITSCPNLAWPAFFAILDNQRSQFLAPICSSGFINSH